MLPLIRAEPCERHVGVGKPLENDPVELIGRCGRQDGLLDEAGLGGDNAWQVLEAGANAIVAGSAVFNAPDNAKAITAIRTSTRPAS